MFGSRNGWFSRQALYPRGASNHLRSLRLSRSGVRSGDPGKSDGGRSPESCGRWAWPCAHPYPRRGTDPRRRRTHPRSERQCVCGPAGSVPPAHEPDERRRSRLFPAGAGRSVQGHRGALGLSVFSDFGLAVEQGKHLLDHDAVHANVLDEKDVGIEAGRAIGPGASEVRVRAAARSRVDSNQKVEP